MPDPGFQVKIEEWDSVIDAVRERMLNRTNNKTATPVEKQVKVLMRELQVSRLENFKLSEELRLLKKHSVQARTAADTINRTLRRRKAKIRLKPSNSFSELCAQLGEYLWLLEKDNPDAVDNYG
jgi:septation ring formation regulator EzrA